jgi:hypothetical protein
LTTTALQAYVGSAVRVTLDALAKTSLTLLAHDAGPVPPQPAVAGVSSADAVMWTVVLPPG